MASESSQVKLRFTLPMSCHICLDRVKEPVICANHHVFCSRCIEAWLQYHNCCPACRTAISPESPCKPILGISDDNSSNKDDKDFELTQELRKVRFEIIRKEYEEEIDQLRVMLKSFREENIKLVETINNLKKRKYCNCQHADHCHDEEIPSKKMRMQEGYDSPKTIWRIADELMVATNSCNDLLSEMKQINESNKKFREENEKLKEEINRLRYERASPTKTYRHGRYVMAAMQSKISCYEREIEQLKKALMRSDKYIEELTSNYVKELESDKNSESDDIAKNLLLNDDKVKESPIAQSSKYENNSSTSCGVVRCLFPGDSTQ
ncbi:uncharacterized protein TRIADDRAFT_56327 [Trichoplax adhaerens]|uniref:RING-type domain-containing protein n=1 Tax=Trichoplax adhaerens TaxID=10228 RepID=B3RXT9_TRIAD|nr:hypothetical protein TRIADDRAFT_56327 [Trichoplax adhaerens]EDV24913.1 hypothetical protein TRIADDRAFT_56327 [Trichoplax adhaerens]|eukprot:XP_002112803.1 hypothetical protein TRIADDRAFT_56327 [Trichoplax adhaerens]